MTTTISDTSADSPTDIVLTMDITKEIPEGYVLLHNLTSCHSKIVIRKEYYHMINSSTEPTIAIGENID